MSKENTTNSILEETSTKIQTTEDTNDISIKEKSLEELENERLQAISQGELPDTAINYSNYTNKPNKIIENPANNTEENPLNSNNVHKINSRPESKELRKRRRKRKISSDSSQEKPHHNKPVSEDKPIKIDTKNNKKHSQIKVEDTNSTDTEFEEKLDLSEKFKIAKENRQKKENEFPKENQGASTGPIDISEKFNLAKAKRTQKIDELNSNLTKVTSKPIKEPPKVEISQTIVKKNIQKDGKKSLKERIENYFFIVEETQSNTDDTSKDKKLKINPFKKKSNKDTPNKTKNDTLKVENTSVKESPIEDISIEKPSRNKFEIKSFIKSLFLGDNYVKKENPPKETFKQRMMDFFYPIEEPIEKILINDTSKEDIKVESPVIEETHKEDIQIESPVIEETSKEDIQIESPVIAETPKEDIQIESPVIAETHKEDIQIESPVIEETHKEDIEIESPVIAETPKEDIQIESPVIAETPKEDIQIESPVIAETPKEDIQIESPVIEETPKEDIQIESPVIEETHKEDIQIESPVIEETPKEDIQIESPIIEETHKEDIKIESPIIEETSKEDIKVESPVIEETHKKDIKDSPTKLSLYRRIKNFFLSEEIQNEYLNETVQEVETSTVTETQPPKEDASIIEDKLIEETMVEEENLILPFNEDTPSEAIDIPIDEPKQYDHFWQDPDFSIVDRIKTYRENYKNRKRSGDFHVEIKSTPDTAILFEDLERKLIAHEKLTKSREEYQKQVANGEYDNFEENPSKKIDEEPIFYENSVSDFNSYVETETIKDYISDMKNSLMVRMVITSLMAILSFYITIANDLELPIPDTLNATISASGYLLVQSILGLLTIITSIKAIFSGIVKIFKGQSDCDSLASMGIVLGFISTVLAYFLGQSIVEDRILNVYMCVGIIGVLCNLWGKNLIIKREEHNFRYISKDREKYGLYCIQDDYDAENITKGLVDDYPVTAYNRKSKFAKDFVKYTYSRDMADKFSQIAVPLIMIVSLLVSVISGIVYNRTFEMQIPVAITSILSMLISFCSCFSISININSMLNRVSEKYPRREGALLGYQAVEDFYDTNSIVLSANDIFPKNSIKLCGMKLFANGKLDETLLYAISLANKCNSILASTLMKIVENKTDYLNEVEHYSYEDDLGICGWIDNKRILMGNRELMEAHNVENLPSKSKEIEFTGSNRDAVYISISGNLALMLIVDITPNKDVKRYLQTLDDNNVSIAITSSDFLVSISRISYLYDIDEENIKIIPYSIYKENKEYFEDKPQCSSSIVTGGNINVLTELLVITKKIHRNALIGNILYAVACILGILIGISFITMGAFKELNPTMILFYNGVCTLITIILTKLKV